MPVSPQYRLFQHQYYLEQSERDAGISHLWHAHRLAEARLRPGKGIADAPEVDFRHPELMDREQTKACALMTRLQRRVLDEEKRIVKTNKNLLDRILDVNEDKYRERRGMNNRPSEEELRRWFRADEQARARQRVRGVQEADKQRQNLIIMRQLIDVKPSVDTAKQLDQWYKREHRKQVKQLSQFKRVEPFAGANVLRKECGLKLAEKEADRVEFRTAARKPFLWREHKVPTLIDALYSGPLLPSLQEASMNYVHGNLTLNNTEGFTSTWTLPRRRKEKKPEWKSISALDVTLMNYANDIMLARGEDVPIVRREEENGVTRLWREGLDQNHRAKERRGKAATRQDKSSVIGDANEGENRRISTNSINWDKNRWRSRKSILTLLRSKVSGSTEKRTLIATNNGRSTSFQEGDLREKPPRLGKSTSIRFEEDGVPFLGMANTESGRLPFVSAQAYMKQADMGQAYKGDADSDQAYMKRTDMGQAYKGDADSDQTYMKRTDMGQAYKGDADSDQVYMKQADMGQAYKGDADSDQVYMKRTDMGQAYKGDADSDQVYMKRTDMGQAYKGDADSDQAYMKRTDMGQAYKGDADSDQVYMKQADMGQAYKGDADSDQVYMKRTGYGSGVQGRCGFRPGVHETQFDMGQAYKGDADSDQTYMKTH
ncbi:hypothetical protein ECC02_002185 [Trypanosoma cruzi]|uniref:Uncharacterized protein n=1 Tax=Trypanosoma cruzi TaxID=5693 RepID=A0A7J6YF18_TRYCR|nr:hypothetical protein ECC02_002185 [Trypanosoma cruzi]